jgi:hypothetical protein
MFINGLNPNWKEMLSKKLSENEQKALEYAEKYGIVEYTVKGCHMIYYENCRTEGLYKRDYNLKTCKTLSKQMKRRNKKAYYNHL